jgi:DNA-binding transcriptional ArsR family regulator
MAEKFEIEFKTDNTGSLKPLSELIIKDLATLQAITDPLRVQIVDKMVKEPRTVKQVAKELGMTPTRLYYHISQLEEHGLIRVVNTRLVSGIVEKQYQATAYKFTVSRSLFSLDEQDRNVASQAIQAGALGLLEATIRDIQQGLANGALLSAESNTNNDKLMVGRSMVELNPAQFIEFQNRVSALLDEFGSQEAGEDGKLFCLTVALYPVISDTSEE